MKILPNLIVLIVWLGLSQYSAASSQFIVNGIDVNEAQAKYYVQIIRCDKRNRNCGFICGGSLIRPNVVISAAHCFLASQDQNYYKIRYGTHAFDQSKYDDIRVLIVTKSNKLTTLQSNSSDLALLRLTRNVQVGPEYIVEMMLDERLRVNDKVEYYGFGLMESNHLSKHLKSGYGSVQPDNKCTVNFKKPTERFFCYKSHNQSICHGDSGGPVIHNGRLVGIITSGLLNKDKCFPGANNAATRLSYHRGMIMNTLDNFNII